MKILFAGHEVGGQMQLFAETLRSRGISATAAAFNHDFRNFVNDVSIKPSKIPFRRFQFALSALNQFDVFHFFWGVSLFDFWMFHGLDLPLLRRLNKKIVVHFRGTDIMNIGYYEYLQQVAQGNTPAGAPPLKMRPDQVEKLKRWKKYADAILVSTPDLLELAGSTAVLVPQVIKLDEWKSAATKTSKDTEVIRIAHAPTRRMTKGTDRIIDAIENLRIKGHKLELVLIENMEYKAVKEVFSTCDIGIDQLFLGWYGKVSIELMAMGKPVICYIDDRFKNVRSDLPFINCTANNLESILENAISDRQTLKDISVKSVQYVEKYHDVNAVTDVLLKLYSK